MARPSLYSEELADEITTRCVTQSMHKVCQSEDMPAESTVYVWLVRHAEFSEKYARARAARAYFRVESIDALMERVASKQVAPDVGRLLMDAIKWQASKENHRVFGDRQQVEHSGGISLEQLVTAGQPKQEG